MMAISADQHRNPLKSIMFAHSFSITIHRFNHFNCMQLVSFINHSWIKALNEIEYGFSCSTNFQFNHMLNA